jgi:YrbI family 3-deoxy-D-manno-octulosonate 8-phosphate phosphatase
MDSDQERLSQRCADIALLVMDVDGVLTDGGIIHTDSGTELKRFHVRDGSAIRIWQQQGKKAAFLSGRSSPAVAARARELGMETVIQGASDKLEGYRRILSQTGVRPEQTCVVADDLPDVPVLANCRLAVAVADACPEVRTMAHYVTRRAGGAGAVRETVELILRTQNCWDRVVEEYRNRKLADC